MNKTPKRGLWSFLGWLLIGLFLQPVEAQEALPLLHQKAYPFELNDIWGWVDGEGREYALVGTENGVSIVALDSEGLPEVAFIPGTRTPWRDLKTYGHFAFVTADGNVDDGLLVIDLSQLPDAAPHFNWKPVIGENQLGACHNLYIDELGRAYLAGCSGINQGGIVILDVTADDGVPSILGLGPPIYAHDVFVQDNLIFAAELFLGLVGIYDGSDPEDVLPLAQAPTPQSFTHNAWASPDNKFLFTTDERANAPTAAFDIQDLGDVRQLGTYRPAASLGQGVIPHNVHVFDRWLVISHYTDGLRIVDASRPTNLVETAFFDTNDNFPVGFHGAWGAYPFLPSGRLLVTDIENGLFVLEPRYERAAYLEGAIREAGTGNPIDGAEIIIENAPPNFAETNAFGQYATGLSGEGTFTVLFDHPAYEPERLTLTLQRETVRIMDVELTPKPRYQVRGEVRFENDAVPTQGIALSLYNEDFTYQPQLEASGQYSFNEVVEGTYQLRVDAWGGLAPEPREIVLDGSMTIDIELEAGYADDFSQAWNWQSSSTALTGSWERGRPRGIRFQDSLTVPNLDLPDDRGELAMLTDARRGKPKEFDVSNGEVWLRSPDIDLNRLTAPKLSFHYWFFHHNAGSPSLQVYLSNGQDSTLLHEFRESGSYWRRAPELQLEDTLTGGGPVYISFLTEDLNQGKGILEAGLDGFLIRGEQSTASNSMPGPTIGLKLYPNPFSISGTLQIDRPPGMPPEPLQLKVIGLDGRVWQQLPLASGSQSLDFGANLPNGMFILVILSKNQVLGRLKFLKQ